MAAKDTENKTWLIESAEEFKAFRDEVNNGTTFDYWTVSLGADIDLAGEENFGTIGFDESSSFRGTFDGNGKTISNLKITSTENNVGLFGYIAGATIRNFTLENADVTGEKCTAAVVGNANSGTIEKVTVQGVVNVSGTDSVGAVAGQGYAILKDITVNVDQKASAVKGTLGYIGGVMGNCFEGDKKLENISSNISVIGESFDIVAVGGIFGYVGGGYNTIDTVECTALYVAGYEIEEQDIPKIRGLFGEQAAVNLEIRNAEPYTGEIRYSYYAGNDPDTPLIYHGAYQVRNNREVTLSNTVFSVSNVIVGTAHGMSYGGDSSAAAEGETGKLTLGAGSEITAEIVWVGGDQTGEGKASAGADRNFHLIVDGGRLTSTGEVINVRFDGDMEVKNGGTVDTNCLNVKTSLDVAGEGTEVTVKNTLTLEGGETEETAAVLNISEGAVVNVPGWEQEAFVGNLNIGNATEYAAVNVSDAVLTAQNINIVDKGMIAVSGESTVSGSVAGNGWIYMNGVSLDENTVLEGANVRFADGENVVDGSTITGGRFQVGIGLYQESDPLVDTENGVTVTVKNNAVISGIDTSDTGAPFGGWVGTAYYDSADDKLAAMTDARYTLNIENSLAEFGYLHISNDGILKVTGNTENQNQNGGNYYSFYAGTLNINGTAVFDGANVLALNTNVSVDNKTDKAGSLTIQNNAYYKVDHDDGGANGGTFKIFNKGIVDVLRGATLDISGPVSVSADAVLNIKSAQFIQKNGTVTNDGTITVDALSSFKAIDITGNGSIIIDASNFAGGVEKIINLSGTASLEGDTRLSINNRADDVSVLYGNDGDVVLASGFSTVTLYADSAWSSKEVGDDLGDGKIFGANAFASFNEAMANQAADTESVQVDSDFAEALAGNTYSGNITTGNADGVTITDSENGAISLEDFSLGENVTLKTGTFYFYGDSEIAGRTESSSTYYNVGKTVTVTGSAEVYNTFNRYNSAETGFFIVGTAAAGKGVEAAVQFKGKGYLGHYSGTFSVKNTAAEFGYILLKGSYDSRYAQAQLIADNALIKTAGGPNTQPGQVEMDDDAAIIATNKSVLDFRGPKEFGYILMEENNSISLNDSTLLLGKEGQGTNTLNGEVTLENNALLSAIGSINNSGTITVTDSTFTAGGKVSNTGTFTVAGESTLNIGSFNDGKLVWDKDTGAHTIKLLDGAVITDSTVGGYVDVVGKVTFRGDNTFTTIQDFEVDYQINNDAVNSTEMIVEAGASVTLNGGKLGIGYGDKITVNGTLEDAKAAYEDGTLTEDDFALDAQTGVYLQANRSGDTSTFDINNAYVRLGDKNKHFMNNKKVESLYGTYNFTWKNAVVTAEAAFRILDSGNYDGRYNFDLTDSVFTIGSIYPDANQPDVYTHHSGFFQFSDKDSTFSATGSKVVSIGTDSDQINAGTLNFTDSVLEFNSTFINEAGAVAAFDGEDASLDAPVVVNNGKIDLTGGASMTVDYYLSTLLDISYYDGNKFPEIFTVVAKDAAGNEIGRTLISTNGGVNDLVASFTGVSYEFLDENGENAFRSSVTVNSASTTDSGEIVLDEASKLTVNKGFENTGTITIDVTDGWTGAHVLIDAADGTSAANFGNIVIDADDAAAGVKYSIDETNGNLVIHNVNTETVYFNTAWAGKALGEKVGDGIHYGYNAFDVFSVENNLLVLPEDTTKVVLTAGNTTSYGLLRMAQSITVSTEGEGYAVIDRFVNAGCDLTFAAGSKIKVNATNTSGANNIPGANGEKTTVTVNGEIWIANGQNCNALYLWGMNETAGQLVINKGGFLWTEAGNVENHGTISVYGKMELGSAGAAPKLAGVGASNGGWHGHLIVDGKDGEGILTVNHNRINFGGGNTSNAWEEPAGDTACTVTISNGGKITTEAVYFRNGAKSIMTIDNGTLEFVTSGSYNYSWNMADENLRYFDNQGIINVSGNGKVDMSGRDFTNAGTFTLTDAEMTVDGLTNSGTFTLAGKTTLNTTGAVGAVSLQEGLVLKGDMVLATVNVDGDAEVAGKMSAANVNVFDNDLTVSGEGEVEAENIIVTQSKLAVSGGVVSGDNIALKSIVTLTDLQPVNEDRILAISFVPVDQHDEGTTLDIEIPAGSKEVRVDVAGLKDGKYIVTIVDNPENIYKLEVTVQQGGLVLEDGDINAGVLNIGYGSVKMDALSTITAESIILSDEKGKGSIDIAVEDYIEDVPLYQKVIDITGKGELNTGCITVDGNAFSGEYVNGGVTVINYENDIYLINAIRDTLYVGTEYAGEELFSLVNDKVVGFNAFADMTELKKALTDNCTDIIFTAGNADSYGDLAVDQDMTLSANGTGVVKLGSFDAADDSADNTVTIAAGASFAFTGDSVVNSGDAIAVNEGAALKFGKVSNAGSIEVTGATLAAVELNNSGSVNVTGNSVVKIDTLDGAIKLDNAALTDSKIVKGSVEIKGANSFTGTFNADKAFVGDWNGDAYAGSIDFGTASDVTVGGQMIIGYDSTIAGANSVVFGSASAATDKVFKSADVSVRRDGVLTIQNTTGENKINTMNVMGKVVIDNAKLDTEVQIGYKNAEMGIEAEMVVQNKAEVSIGWAQNSPCVVGKSSGGKLTVDNAFVTVNHTGTGGGYQFDANDTFYVGLNGAAGVVDIKNNGNFHAKYDMSVNAASSIKVTDSTLRVDGKLTGGGDITVAGNSTVIAAITGDLTLADKVVLGKDSVITVNGNVAALGDLELTTNSGNLEFNGNITVEGDLDIAAGVQIAGDDVWTVKGDFALSGTNFAAKSLTVNGNMVVSDIAISGSTVTVYEGAVSLGGSLTINGQTVDDGGRVVFNDALYQVNVDAVNGITLTTPSDSYKEITAQIIDVKQSAGKYEFTIDADVANGYQGYNYAVTVTDSNGKKLAESNDLTFTLTDIATEIYVSLTVSDKYGELTQVTTGPCKVAVTDCSAPVFTVGPTAQAANGRLVLSWTAFDTFGINDYVVTINGEVIKTGYKFEEVEISRPLVNGKNVYSIVAIDNNGFAAEFSGELDYKAPEGNITGNGIAQIVGYDAARGAVGYIANEGVEAPLWEGIWEWGADSPMKPVAIGHFAGTDASHSGLLFYNEDTFTFGAWTDITNPSYGYVALGNAGSAVEVKAIGKFDGNYNDDILVVKEDGSIGIMNDVKGYAAVTSGNAVELAGAGSFGAANGLDSIVVEKNGEFQLWNTDDVASGKWNATKIMNADNQQLLDITGNWEVSAIGDFKGDGIDDIIMTDEKGFSFLLNDGKTDSVEWAGAISSDFEVAGVGDYNGDGTEDLLLREMTSGWGGLGYWNGGNAGTWVDLNARIETSDEDGHSGKFSVITVVK